MLRLDSAFTEKVLGPPSENFKGYVEADLTQRARLVPSHSLYLLHGLADLSAPYTHGVAFAKALSEAGVIFRYQVGKDINYYIISYVYILIYTRVYYICKHSATYYSLSLSLLSICHTFA